MKSIAPLILTIMIIPCLAATYTVDANGAGDYPTIQAAIDDANDDDEIILLPGIFTGDGNRDIDFLGKAITVRSIDPNDSGIAAATIIDCNGTESNPHHGFHFQNGEDSNSILSGLTIIHGYNESGASGIFCENSGPTIRNCVIRNNYMREGIVCAGFPGALVIGCNISDNTNGGLILSYGGPSVIDCNISNNFCNDPDKYGGGIFCFKSYPEIVNCNISRNSSAKGGGIYCFESGPWIYGCKIIDNEATDAGPQYGGGGIYFYDSYPVLNGCRISDNNANDAYGGGLYFFNCDSPPMPMYYTSAISDTIIINNIAQKGGGIACFDSDPCIVNCTVKNNFADFDGGGFYCESSAPYICNTVITRNGARRGGGFYLDRSRSIIVNCNVIRNISEDIPAGIRCDSSPATSTSIINSILWDNADTDCWPEYNTQIQGNAQIMYSCIKGGWPGENNIDENPKLTANGHLSMDSPCINTGTNNYAPLQDIDGELRPAGGEIDIGVDEYVDADMDGLPDWWEIMYFDSNIVADSNSDTDGDTLINLMEYWYNTFPNIPPNIFYVNPITGNDNYDGLSSNYEGSNHGPKKTIQAGVDLCKTQQNDIVILAEGTYSGTGNRGISFGGRAITVRSTDPEDSNVVSNTIINCNWQDRAFKFVDDEHRGSILSGLTMHCGEAPFTEILRVGYEHRYGGAIFCKLASPTIERCSMEYNSADDAGGAIYTLAGSPLVTCCKAITNGAPKGGAFYALGGSPEINNCIVDKLPSASIECGQVYFDCYSSSLLTDCQIGISGGGQVYCNGSRGNILNSTITKGGGLYCNEYCNLVLSNCTISDNLQSGIYCWRDCNIIVTDCNISRNAESGIYSSPANNTAKITKSCLIENIGNNGGGICWNDNIVVRECVIRQNTATHTGGGIFLFLGYGLIENSIINGNQAGNYGGGIHLNNDSLVNNSIISDNTAYTGGGISECGTVMNCTIVGNLAQNKAGGLYNCDMVENCIVWQNRAPSKPQIDKDLQDFLGFNCIQNYTSDLGGIGNIDFDPCFIVPGYWDPNGDPPGKPDEKNDFWVDGNYHLKSTGWRWDSVRSRWDYDDVTSRCIDAGNPGSPLADEPLTIPDDPNNVYGQNLRINMGAYGGTAEASMPPYDWALLCDIDNSGSADFVDYASLTMLWMQQDDELFADFNRDAKVDANDLYLLTEDWLMTTTWH